MNNAFAHFTQQPGSARMPRPTQNPQPQSKVGRTLRVSRPALSILGIGAIAFLVASNVRAVTLDDAVAAALENSPTLQAAEARIDSAQAMLQQAKSYYYPSIGLSAAYTRSDNPIQAFMMQLNQRQLNMADPAFDPNDPDDAENVRGSVGVQWRLFDRQRDAGRHMARFGAAAGAQALAAARNQLVHEVTRGFYGVLQAQAFAEVQEKSVQSIAESLRIARERFDAGSAVKTDVLNLETQLAQANEDLIRARNGAQLAVAALNAAIGDDLVAPDTIETPAMAALDAPPPKCTNPQAYEDRPELRAARLMRQVKEQDVRKAKGGYVPTVSAFGSYDLDSEDASDFEDSYMAGVMAEINVFDGARTRAAVRAARADLAAARADEEQARLNLKLDLQQAFLGAQEAWERLEVVRKSLETAEEARRIVQEQYQLGAADVSILLQTQVGATAMETRAAAARYDYLTALSNLKRAKGELGKTGDRGQ
ncbi:MAG: TolC family protein [Spartobacteria bacterium]|nr:TolC family protein [Spartobacteria bacterium]